MNIVHKLSLGMAYFIVSAITTLAFFMLAFFVIKYAVADPIRVETVKSYEAFDGVNLPEYYYDQEAYEYILNTPLSTRINKRLRSIQDARRNKSMVVQHSKDTSIPQDVSPPIKSNYNRPRGQHTE